MNYSTKQIALLSDEIDLQSIKYPSAQLAVRALLKEICLSPKPGLVDMLNNGAHRDMDFSTFIASIKAISPWFDEFYHYGYTLKLNNQSDFLVGIRPIGLACEKAMYLATHNVNTHKGGIFAFGLLLGVIGYLEQCQQTTNVSTICSTLMGFCHGIVKKELQLSNSNQTVGEKLFKHYQLSGARGEAESGYATVRQISLPIYNKMQQAGYDEETSLLQVMLHLLAYNQDTNLVSRGGLAGLHFVQNSAKQLIERGGATDLIGRSHLEKLDKQLIKHNLSPGGSADLIAITWFLAQYQN